MQGIDNTRAGGALSSLSDVNISSPAVGDLLIYNGSEWINDDFAGGHTILNESGTAVTDEANLQFTSGLKVTDDDENNITKVEVDTTFTEAETRTNIASGDTFSTILGKIKKWFSDLASMFVSKSGDTMTGGLTLSGSDLTLGTPGSNSNDSGDLVYTYGNGREKMRIWTEDTYNAGYGPTYRVYKSDGTQLYYGRLATIGEVPTKVSQLTNDSGFITSSGSCSYATNSGSSSNAGLIKTLRQENKNYNSASDIIPYNGQLCQMAECGPSCSNKPENAWFFVISFRSADTSYGAQFAIGMTTTNCYFRNLNVGTWSAWKKVTLS